VLAQLAISDEPARNNKGILQTFSFPECDGLPFALKILVRHFPGSFSNALISNPLYCMARPVAFLHSGTQR
jgi:hypothetical protein